ncbi:MAG: hypothetical protein ACKO70_00765 [Actinomycetota bacterium]
MELIRDVSDAEAVIPISTHRYAEQPNRESRAILRIRCLMAAGRLTDAASVASNEAVPEGVRRRLARDAQAVVRAAARPARPGARHA